MVITYVGGYCFKLSAGSTTVVVNPPSQKSAHKVSKFSADVALISTFGADWDGEETVTHGGKEPFVIRGPGAYEVGDIAVNGYATEGAVGGETSDFRNTIYSLHFDGMHVLLLGSLSNAKLPQNARADLDDVDILFVPVGGETLDAKGAHALATSLEAHLTIPYQVGKGDDVKDFLKAAGATSVKPTDKLTLRSKEVKVMSGEIALLK